ncbi:MAG: hypothetical protein R2867_12390 [Caldilineaceae bacterium]
MPVGPLDHALLAEILSNVVEHYGSGHRTDRAGHEITPTKVNWPWATI